MPQVIRGGLNLSSKNLTDITGLQNIPGINQAHRLYLNLNKLQVLPANIFNGLHNLQDLYLNNNQLQTLPPHVFNNLNNLQKLHLDTNKLQMLPATLFNGLNNLKYLSLYNNQLQMLPDTIFNGLTNLKQLALHNNRLSPTLPASIFNGLTNLQDLSLNNNQLQRLPKNIFNGLNLKELNLKGNSFSLDFIPTLTNMIRKIQTLQSLNGKPKDQALKEVPFSTLKQSAAAYITKNIADYRPRFQELPEDLREEMPD